MTDRATPRVVMPDGDRDSFHGHSLVIFGTGDTDIPRSRMLLNAARALGFELRECRIDAWAGLRDKTVAPLPTLLRRLLVALLGYPSLIFRYLRLPRHDAVIVPHPGWLDVLVLWPFARLRRAPIVWDAFLPLHEALIEDRTLWPAGSVRARMLSAIEWLTCRAADRLLSDTEAHADYMRGRYALAAGRVHRVFVGAEDRWFGPMPAGSEARTGPFTVLFYGQFIPLQGVDVIVDAATILARAGEDIAFIVIGGGQEATRIDRRLGDLALPNLRRVPWVEYGELALRIGEADICLGIFGGSEKAGRVIPNKVFQAIACRRPFVSLDSPAMRELQLGSDVVKLIPPGDPQSLADSILEIRSIPPDRLRRDVARFPAVGVDLIAMHLREALVDLIDRRMSDRMARSLS